MSLFHEGDQIVVVRHNNSTAMITMAAPEMRPTGCAAARRHRSASVVCLLYDEHLSALPGVQRLTSTLVMKEVVVDRPLPLLAR